MKAPLERIRVSQRSRDTLVTLKRRTGIEHWNVLCRWAFLDSLANPNRPVAAKNLSESNLEMHWDVFAGDLADYLLAALAMRASKDGVKPNKIEMAEYFRSHLERGIMQLQSAADLSELCKRALQTGHRG
jgi:DNA sulfur modification protein DndE